MNSNTISNQHIRNNLNTSSSSSSTSRVKLANYSSDNNNSFITRQTATVTGIPSVSFTASSYTSSTLGRPVICSSGGNCGRNVNHDNLIRELKALSAKDRSPKSPPSPIPPEIPVKLRQRPPSLDSAIELSNRSDGENRKNRPPSQYDNVLYGSDGDFTSTSSSSFHNATWKSDHHHNQTSCKPPIQLQNSIDFPAVISSWKVSNHSISCPLHLSSQAIISSSSQLDSSNRGGNNNNNGSYPQRQTHIHQLHQSGSSLSPSHNAQSELPQSQTLRKNNFSTNRESSQTDNRKSNEKIFEDEKPPPLPPKKRNIIKFMQLLDSYCGPNDAAFNLYRHSVHSYHLINTSNRLQTWQQLESTFTQQRSSHKSFLSTTTTSTTRSSESSINSLDSQGSQNIPPPPTHSHHHHHHRPPPPPPVVQYRPPATIPSSVPQPTVRQHLPHSASCSASIGDSVSNDQNKDLTSPPDSSPSQSEPPSLPPKKKRSVPSLSPVHGKKSESTLNANIIQDLPLVSKADLTRNSSVSDGQNVQPSSPLSLVPSSESGISSQSDSNRAESDDSGLPKGILDQLDVSSYLVYKNPGEDGPDIRGGPVDALIVKATEVSKNDFLFQEAFLTTYRTFITPTELVNKILYRCNKFINYTDSKQRAAKIAFALLVWVVDDFCISDCTESLMQTLLEFVYQLESRGDLALARVLRDKVVEKLESRRNNQSNNVQVLLPSVGVSTKTWTLHDFKSSIIAEQMTLLDAALFQKIEIAEYLLWAREQKEELIPNLNKFTEHFNNMSYWARSRLVELEDNKEREKLATKFLKIMKHLRKMNNFNSYLALLSALDSGPLRRLDWPKSITETLKDYCSLIDSSSSFRAYRQALAETQPPCIPYIGLILQDLTFVHVGNNDYLQDSSGVNINFAKRWQIFNILDQMRRFRSSNYPFRKNEQVLAFFNNFDNYLSEEAIWQISESMKPRNSSKTKT